MKPKISTLLTDHITEQLVFDSERVAKCCRTLVSLKVASKISPLVVILANTHKKRAEFFLTLQGL